MFQWIFSGILFIFLGLMIYVTSVAYTRHSGSTYLNMFSIQKMRYESQANK